MTEEAVKTQFAKSVLCKFYATGSCTKGAICQYAHSDEELRTPPDLTKTSLCKDWKMGMCSLPSSNCAFAHGLRELRMTPHFMACRPQVARKKSKQSKDVTTQVTQVYGKESMQPEEPPATASSTVNDVKEGNMGSYSNAANSATLRGSALVEHPAVQTINLESYLLSNPSPVIHEVANIFVHEAKISMTNLSCALPWRMNADHALAQCLIDAMPEFYED